MFWDYLERFLLQEVTRLDYSGPKLVEEYFSKYAKERRINKDSAILDVGAGTGLVGQVVSAPPANATSMSGLVIRSSSTWATTTWTPWMPVLRCWT